MEEPEPISINQLPNEILTEVLSYVPTLDLLHTCRVVSRLWYEISTPICRKNYVTYTGLIYPPVHIFTTYDDINNLPWSRISLIFIQNRFYFESRNFSSQSEYPHIHQVIETFGSKLKAISVKLLHCSYATFANLLKLMPYLEELEITTEHDPLAILNLPPVEYPNVTDIKLPKLTVLELQITTTVDNLLIDFLDFLCTVTQEYLEVFEFSINSWQEINMAAEEFERILQIVIHWSRNVILSLSLPYSGINSGWLLLASSQRDLFLYELTVTSKAKTIPSDDYFQVLENLLANCNRLNSLTLRGFYSDEISGPISTSRCLNIPILPKLRVLTLKFVGGQLEESYTLPEFSYLHFKPPLQTTQFPKLENVSIEADRGYNGMCITRIFSTGNSELNFHSVKSLEVKYYNGYTFGRWAKVFPNLTKLNATIKNAIDLRDIFTNINKLEMIKIKFDTQYGNKNFSLRKSFHPLHDFKGLRAIHVVLPNVKARPREAVTSYFDAAAWFLLLPPMELKISNAQISDKLASILRARHQKFELA